MDSADLAAGRREQIVVAAGGACVRVASVAADLGEAALEVAVFDVEVHWDLREKKLGKRTDLEERVCLIAAGHSKLKAQISYFG